MDSETEATMEDKQEDPVTDDNLSASQQIENEDPSMTADSNEPTESTKESNENMNENINEIADENMNEVQEDNPNDSDPQEEANILDDETDEIVEIPETNTNPTESPQIETTDSAQMETNEAIIEPTAGTVVVVEDISNPNSTEKSKEIEISASIPIEDPEPIEQPPSTPQKPEQTERVTDRAISEYEEDPQSEVLSTSTPQNMSAEPMNEEIPSKRPEDMSTPLSPDQDRVELNNPDGFGKDFNWEMHRENEELRRENAEIVVKLKEKETEIATLEEALTTLHEELKFLESQEVQSVAKDLAKKNRKLSVQLQRERNRAAQTHIESQRLRSELESYSHHNFSPKKVVEPLSFSHRPLTERSERGDVGSNEDGARDPEKGQDPKESVEMDLQKMKSKLVATKNQLAMTKDLHNKMKMALQRELGVDTLDLKTIHDIIRDGGSWKGRSEKIALLQSRLDATKRELELMNDIGRGARAQNENVVRSKNEEHKHQISQIAMERMKQYESAQEEIERLDQTVDELRGLVKAKNSRIKGLENTASSSRQKLQFFVKKSKSDDSLIETLQSQLNQQLKLQNALTKKEKALNRSNTQMTSLSETIKTQNAKIELLNQTIDEMKSKILEQSQQRTDRLEKLFSRWNDDDKNYQIGLLKSENETQKDVISSYKKNLVALQKRLSRKASPREQPPITTGRTAKNSKVLQLREKMDAMNQEQQLVKASYLSIIEGKEQEIAICRKMLKDQDNIHQNAITDLHAQIQEIKKLVLKK